MSVYRTTGPLVCIWDNNDADQRRSVAKRQHRFSSSVSKIIKAFHLFRQGSTGMRCIAGALRLCYATVCFKKAARSALRHSLELSFGERFFATYCCIEILSKQKLRPNFFDRLFCVCRTLIPTQTQK